MSTIRLNKYEQTLLCQIWRSMPAVVRDQLTQESVRDIDIDPVHAVQAVDIIAEQLAGTRCEARTRRLEALRDAIAPAAGM